MADILIEPVTRIIGSARVRVILNESNQPEGARFQAFGYRGFEQFVVGSHVDNLLPIVSRICGSDSVFHQIAAARAVEMCRGFTPPEGVLILRKLAMYAQLFERHAISLTMHSLPDLLFPSSDPGVRNIISIHRVDEEVARRVLDLKSLGTAVLAEVAGGGVHAVNFVPGGVIRGVDEEVRKKLIGRLEQAKPLLLETGRLIKMLLRRNEEAVNNLGIKPTAYLAIKGEGGMALEGDRLTVIKEDGASQEDLASGEIPERVEEIPKPHSHIKGVSLSRIGDIRVGALARLNVNRLYGTQMADEELDEIKSMWGFPLHQSMISHAARMVEMINAWEKMMEILREAPGEEVSSGLTISPGRGVGVVEGPEGTMIYDLVLDEEGRVRKLRITAPLQFNLPGLEGSLAEGAQNMFSGGELGERERNRLEMAVRAYAPCTLCGVH
ncbi:MAG: nickel-dependent hydrogenase large subunit [Actinomycetota bacterium]|nr:nickel-dependent hydrogenase large subunit [Actinomycetota bacterium]